MPTFPLPIAAPQGAVQLLVRGEVAALPLKGVIDLSAEKARLDKEIAKADADIKRVDAKLSNEKFVANAPEEIVEEEKEKREAARGAKGQDPRGAGAAQERVMKEMTGTGPHFRHHHQHRPGTAFGPGGPPAMSVSRGRMRGCGQPAQS